jgi:RNA polymerase sigma-70 factor, ECF subfamily
VPSPAEGAGEAMQKTVCESIRLTTFNQYRGLLFSIAYRMLGSVADAEDMEQEAFIRWQQAPEDEIRSPRAFLVTVISRLCINQLQSARARREEYVGQWLPEPLVTDAGSDPLGIIRVDESLSMAFLILLERLTAVERAVFLLREVFEYEYSEIAAILGQNGLAPEPSEACQILGDFFRSKFLHHSLAWLLGCSARRALAEQPGW